MKSCVQSDFCLNHLLNFVLCYHSISLWTFIIHYMVTIKYWGYLQRWVAFLLTINCIVPSSRMRLLYNSDHRSIPRPWSLLSLVCSGLPPLFYTYRSSRNWRWPASSLGCPITCVTLCAGAFGSLPLGALHHCRMQCTLFPLWCCLWQCMLCILCVALCLLIPALVKILRLANFRLSFCSEYVEKWMPKPIADTSLPCSYTSAVLI